MTSRPNLTLDHVALVTPNLERSRQDYETLGFLLTPESSHKGKVSPEGEIELWGSGNHCAMFQQGYLEILGVTDPERSHDHVQVRLDRYHGVQLIALGCQDAETLYAEANETIPGLQEPVEVGRDVPQGLDGEKTEEGLFRLVHLDDAFPEAELFFIEHATPGVLWQEELLSQPNGVIGLAGATICSLEPRNTVERFERATLHNGAAEEGRTVFPLEEGWVAITGRAYIDDRFEGATLPAIPSVAVVTFEVERLDETKKFLESKKVTVRPSKHGLWVRPERAGGVILEFTEP